MESICQQYQSTMGDDVHTLINHYVSLIRRHLVSSSKIAKLCQKIYKQHQPALDLIYEHRPDLQSEISEFLQQIIRDHQQDDLEEDKHIKTRIRFAPKEWDDLAFQKTCDKWTSSKRILLFEFVNEPQYLGLHLVIAPGDQEIKQNIYQAIKKLNISGIDNDQLKKKWSHVWKLKILDQSDYSEGDWENIQSKIKSSWDKHLQQEVKQIREAISNAATLK